MSAIFPIWASLAACALLVPLAGESVQPAAPSAPSTASLTNAQESSSVTLALADGDCTKILDTAAMASSMGKSKSVGVYWGDPLLAFAGGLDCHYTVGAYDNYAASVDLQILPSAITDSGSIERSLTEEDCSSGPYGNSRNSGCRQTATVGGWWYSLAVYHFSSAKKQRAGFTTIKANLEKALTAISAPTQVDPPKKFDCATAVPSGMTVTERRILPDTWPGPDVLAAELYAAAYLASGPATCRFTMANGKGWDVTVYPGGAALFYRCGHFSTVDDYPGPSSTITISGVKSTYGKVATNDGPLFCSTDGTSTVSVSGDYDIVLNAKARATVSTILVPVLAAAG
jgi:hypothetical protein